MIPSSSRALRVCRQRLRSLALSIVIGFDVVTVRGGNDITIAPPHYYLPLRAEYQIMVGFDACCERDASLCIFWFPSTKIARFGRFGVKEPRRSKTSIVARVALLMIIVWIQKRFVQTPVYTPIDRIVIAVR